MTLPPTPAQGDEPRGWPGVSEPLPNARLRVLSLGAGVQSSTLALMAARGEIGPMPDCAIFADTQWEPQGVYDWLTWLEAQLPFPVYRVTAGSLRAKIGSDSPTRRFIRVEVPAFIEVNGRAAGMVQRQCTRDFKVHPIIREVRRLTGLTSRRAPKEPIVEQWIGISRDEMQRMKASGEPWIRHRWPLIEAGMDRRDCIRWMEERQYPKPSKSACIGCPYHSASEWRRVADDPVQLVDAIMIDDLLRGSDKPAIGDGGKLYLHYSRRPLREVNFDEPDDGQADLFQNECEGMCGV